MFLKKTQKINQKLWTKVKCGRNELYRALYMNFFFLMVWLFFILKYRKSWCSPQSPVSVFWFCCPVCRSWSQILIDFRCFFFVLLSGFYFRNFGHLKFIDQQAIFGDDKKVNNVNIQIIESNFENDFNSKEIRRNQNNSKMKLPTHPSQQNDKNKTNIESIWWLDRYK